uniref:ZnMc domain-containing protein n=1 Tax=Heterorhabditis bacteriophora TaxID=37862 RepID=A0A1I7XTC0_HETBA
MVAVRFILKKKCSTISSTIRVSEERVAYSSRVADCTQTIPSEDKKEERAIRKHQAQEAKMSKPKADGRARKSNCCKKMFLNILNRLTHGQCSGEFMRKLLTHDENGMRSGYVLTNMNHMGEIRDQRFFPYVLAHEIGHALGLQHSKKAEALMNPFYKNIPLDQIQLDIDDKCGINWNYIGSSNFCLFVWLMSEIIPLYQNSQLMGSSNHYNNNPDPDTKPSKRKLKQFRIPRCLSTNDLQALSEMKLQRILHFPPEEARQYNPLYFNAEFFERFFSEYLQLL